MVKRSSHRQILADLTALTETLISTRDLTELYAQLTRRIAQITRARACLIATYNKTTRTFITQRPHYGAEEKDGVPLEYEVTPEKRKLWNFRLRGTLMSNKAGSDPRVDPYFAKKYRVRSVIFAPMIVQDDLIGLIVIMNKRGGFKEFDSYLASLIAYQAGIILTNARLMDEEKRRVRQIALLNETATQINSSLFFEDVLQHAIDAVVNTLRKNEVAFYVPEPGNNALRLTACAGAMHEQVMLHGPYIQSVDQGVIGYCYRTGKTVVANDARRHPHFLAHDLLVTNSEVCIPVKRGNTLLAVLNVESPEFNAFSPSDVSFLETLADHLAVAYYNASIFQKERKHNDHMLLLNELVSELALIRDPKYIAKATVEKIKQRFEYYFVAMGWVDEEQLTVKDWYYLPHFEVVERDAPHGLSIHKGVTGKAVLTRQSVLVRNVAEHPDYFNILPEVKSELSVPVLIGDTPVAVIDLESNRLDGFDESDQLIMETLADALSTAIQNAISYQHLERINAQLSETSRMKDEIVQIVAHDFRSPLTVIRGYMDYLLKKGEWKDDKQRDIMNTVSNQAQRLQRLAEATLKASRLDSGDIAYSYEKLDFRSFLQRLIFPFSEKHVFTTTIAPDIPLIRADAGRLQEIMENLISNAVKYSPAGGQIEVSVRSARGSELPADLHFPEDDRFLVVSVTDEGIGIPPHKKKLLFQRFTRLHEIRRIEGIGLGLYITKKMLETHGGKIWLEDREKGSRFTFALPAFEAIPATEHILIVDDDIHTLRILHKTISESGYEVVTAADANEALDKIMRFAPRLIVLDALMPGISGEELVRRLRSGSDTGNIPIIIFSGKTDFHLAEEFGSIPVVSKNAGVTALLERIKEELIAKTHRPQS